MDDIVLYCCTYKKDLNRVLKMIESVEKHNKDSIKLFISVPENDLQIFNNYLDKKKINFNF